jgi:OmpA-OmpF porin, OOP family
MSKKMLLALAVLALAALIFFCIKTHAPEIAQKLGLATQPSVSSTTAKALTPPSLNAAIADGKVTLTGPMPTEVARNSVTLEAKKVFGENNVVDQMTVSNGVAPATWLPLLPQIFAAGKSVNNAEVGIKGNALIITAEVPTQGDKTALISQITAAAGSGITVNDRVSVAAGVSGLQNKLNDLLLNRVIEFESAKAVLTGKGTAILDEVTPLIKQSSSAIEIAGHTDSRGSPAANQQLSQARAEAVRDYLVAKGIDASRLKPIGYGPSRPVADNNTREGQQKNRRIEFSVKP